MLPCGPHWVWAALLTEPLSVIAHMASFYSVSSPNCLKLSLAGRPAPDLVPEFTFTSPMTLSYFTHYSLRAIYGVLTLLFIAWPPKLSLKLEWGLPGPNDSFISHVCKTCTA